MTMSGSGKLCVHGHGAAIIHQGATQVMEEIMLVIGVPRRAVVIGYWCHEKFMS